MSDPGNRPHDLRYFGGIVIPSGGIYVFQDNSGFDFIQVLKTSADLQVQLDGGVTYPLWNRSTLDISYKQFTLQAAQAAGFFPAPPGAITCDIQIGKGRARDLPPVQDIIQTINSPTSVSCGTTATTQVCSANKDVWRRQLVNESAVANFVKLGDNTISASSGYQLTGTSNIILYGGGPIFAFNPSGTTAQTIAYTEEKY